MTAINDLYDTKDALKAKLLEVEMLITEQESIIRKEVLFSKKGDTITLTFGDDVYKVTRNERRRAWRIRQNDKLINSEYRGNMNDLRLSIATGRF
jgi:hypothetical protein